MRKLPFFGLLFLSISMLSFKINAQGCSDAGFCTMGAMKPDQAYNKNLPVKLRSIDVMFYEGQTNLSANIKAAIIDMGFSTKNNISLQVKVPYMWVNGNFGRNSGVGDLSFSATKKVLSNRKYDVLATLGAKIPTGRSNEKHEERDVVLPMYYQLSLGTYDFIMGASLISKDWLISAGYQQPLIHQNRNSFKGNRQNWSWYDGGTMEYVWKHNEALELKRGADIMMRLERNFRLSRFNFNIGLLPIYRITKDQGKDENGDYQKLEGTTGLALSGLAGIGYRFNVFSSVKMIFGMQLADRDFNPDGLTRKHVLNISYNYNF